MTIQTVPLSSLQPPADNPRRRIDASTLDGLAASIKADGLLQNLVVVRAGKDRYRIVSGERRFRALSLLAERGDIESDHAVPVEVRERLGKHDTLRIATVENLQREDLPPLDQAAALGALIRKGTTLDDIVDKTGLSATTLRRRLALNTLCEEARSALADGAITLAQAQALTLGPPEGQRAILEELEGGHSRLDADDIREHFLDDRVAVSAAIFPRERYTGTLTTDLFQDAETSYFDDPEQFLALQREAVAALATQHRESAAWVEVTQSHRPPTWQYDEAADGQPSGVLINLAPNGRVEIVEGLVRSPEIDDDTAVATRQPAPARAPRKATYPVPLCRLIAAHKTLAVQEVLLADPRKAREVSAVAQLVSLSPHAALRTLADQPSTQSAYEAVGAQAALMARALGLDVEDGTPAWQTLADLRSDHRGALYDAVKALSDTQLDQLLTLLAVLPFGQDNLDRLDTGASLFNRVAGDLAIDMRNHWRMDAEFLNRRTREQLVGIAQETGLSDGHSLLRSWKKAELVSALLRHAEQARAAGEPTPAQLNARNWLPGVMHFPAVDPDQTKAEASSAASDDDHDDADGDRDADEGAVDSIDPDAGLTT